MPVTRLLRIPRFTVRRLMVTVAAIAVVLAVCLYPIAGLRFSHTLRDGSYVNFYNQYRLWPASRVTHCLETTSPFGKDRKTYPFAVNAGIRFVEVRWNSDQSIIWFVEQTPQGPLGGVLCSLDRNTGRFVRYGGEHPEVVAE